MDLRARLKFETSQVHDQVEASSKMGRLLQEDLTRDEYIRLLARMYSIYEPLEAALRTTKGIKGWLPDYDKRWKTESLRQDLKSLDAEIPAKNTPIQIYTFPEAVGMLYVLEGSTLGARVIAQSLRKRDFINQDQLTFFTHYGDQSGSYWQRFLAALENIQPQDHDAALAGAKRAFQLFL